MEASRDAGSIPAASIQSHFARDRKVAFFMGFRYNLSLSAVLAPHNSVLIC